MYFELGYWPNLKKPRSLNEKIVHSKLYKQNTLFPLVADKWLVREYVAQRVNKNILNEVYWVGKDPEEIPFDELPNKFVIKPNHGSHALKFVFDKNELDRKAIIEECKKWLNTKYGDKTRAYELYYDEIDPQIIVENFIDDGNTLPYDYKFYCFHGSVKYIHVICDRLENFGELVYDSDWNLTGCYVVNPSEKRLQKPSNLDEMIKIAETLSSEFEYLRVDLYSSIEGKIIFGELTVSQAGGIGKFHPDGWDFKLGELW